MHKVFITHHHDNDQIYKERLVTLGNQHGIFIDRSVDTGDISDDLTDEAIRTKIRDEYLRDSTVTIVLVGTETKKRKHVDWEIYSSMFDGKVNKKSGILVVNLPQVDKKLYTATHKGEIENVYPNCLANVGYIKPTYSLRYPYVPERIIDNLPNDDVFISVTGWSIVCNPKNLRFLINATFDDRVKCNYDLSRPMKRRNS